MNTTKLIAVAAGALALSAGAGTTKLDLRSVTGAELECAAPGGWTFKTESAVADGIETVTVRMSAPKPERPPEFSVTFKASAAGAYNVWSSPYDGSTRLFPINWAKWRYSSQLASSLPVVAAYGLETNVLALACSEALRKVHIGLGYDPPTGRLAAGFRLFSEPEAPISRYEVKLRIDTRRVFWADAVMGASAWTAAAGGHVAAKVPADALEPLYSTWYSFWQDVTAPAVERELAAAAALGMKTAILDDGWQKEKSRLYYSKTGDWMPVAARFPDMKAHVAKAHALGLKYMLWLSVPYVGDESAAWKRFEGKYLHIDRGSGAGVLDPRFPEVREHLISTYERVIREWGFDGVKLDFIDEFRLRDGEADPAIAENYRGRDIRSVPEAVDRLMTDVLARLRALKPDVLVEFRQEYIGPAIRKYGNMLRAADCPYDFQTNRRRIADLRLTSGRTAVHSDMIAWSGEETPEGAALPILNCLFSTIQYSLRFGDIPESHKDVIRKWIAFAREHRAALLEGTFTAHHPELGYTVLEGESATERVIAVYDADAVVRLGALTKPVYLVNATGASSLAVEFPDQGLVRVAVEPSGFARLGPAERQLADRIAAKHRIIAKDDFYGFRRTRFDFGGCEAWVVEPSVPAAEGRPWTWTMQWASAFVPRTPVLHLLREGWHHVTIITSKYNMNDEGVALSRDFQRFLVEDLGLAPKACLVGMSWGGFFSTRYAAAHPDCVAAIYYDCPLMNLGSHNDPNDPWDAPQGASWADDPRMPVNLAEPIAKAGIPAYLLYGAVDAVVPPKDNCETFVPRFKAAGGRITVDRRGAYAHHPHGLEVDDRRLADFFIRSFREAGK